MNDILENNKKALEIKQKLHKGNYFNRFDGNINNIDIEILNHSFGHKQFKDHGPNDSVNAYKPHFNINLIKGDKVVKTHISFSSEDNIQLGENIIGLLDKKIIQDIGMITKNIL